MRESKRLKQLAVDQPDSTNVLTDITNASVTPRRTPTSRLNLQRERAAVATASGKKVRELTEEVEISSAEFQNYFSAARRGKEKMQALEAILYDETCLPRAELTRCSDWPS
ncbi:unnamed protein product [Bursaphelenchus xylophilus]|uniref:(pine wood nematode) hypothetical protein n=1 Tax=Bursaphelenchus xylophilus TaxID=6326 RepID=A0A7I8WX55_BURXY|nr:unnamed protein product [Bursaphelenchus xylophilus]CAG9100096.1 unnamed protein product [Bursaphelenchus xylophilus]